MRFDGKNIKENDTPKPVKSIKEYRQQFIDLYEEMQREHGSVSRITLEDTNELRRNQMPINSDMRWIDCNIIFK